MAPIEYLAGVLAIPVVWAAVHLVLGLKELKPVREFERLSRPAQLALAFFGSILFVVTLNWLVGSPLNERLRFVFDNYGSDKLERQHVQFWSSLTYSLTFIISLPIAFLLWHWRDKNVTDQIDNARKDINLKEFLEVQLRAAGALDKEKYPDGAREQLQIAALHQLRGFLRGDFGPEFKRPAFELLLAGHAATIEQIGLRNAVENWQKKNYDPEYARRDLHKILKNHKEKLSSVAMERIKIIQDDYIHFFHNDFTKLNRNFDLIDFSNCKDLSQISFMGSSFIGKNFSNLDLIKTDFRLCNLSGAELNFSHIENSMLNGVNLIGAKLYRSNLDGAILSHSNLKGADLGGATLRGAEILGTELRYSNMSRINLEGAFLVGAELAGTDLSDARLAGANLSSIDPSLLETCQGATFDDSTIFVDQYYWQEGEPTSNDEVRDGWQAKGARHLDDPKPDKAA